MLSVYHPNTAILLLTHSLFVCVFALTQTHTRLCVCFDTLIYYALHAGVEWVVALHALEDYVAQFYASFHVVGGACVYNRLARCSQRGDWAHVDVARGFAEHEQFVCHGPFVDVVDAVANKRFLPVRHEMVGED